MPDERGLIQSVQRAMRLLGCFTPERDRWSVTELAKRTGLHKSVVTRLMATMAQDGFVVQDPATRVYGVGPKAFAVGNAYRPFTILSQIAEPVIRRLTDSTGHSTSVGVPAGDRFVYLLSNDSKRPVRVVASVGEERDYHANSIGKALLAGMADDEVRDLVGPGPLRAHTDRTITALPDLLRELEAIRRTGIARNEEESMLGVSARAAPIVDPGGRVVAAVSAVYPAQLVPADDVRQLELQVAEAARAISRALPG